MKQRLGFTPLAPAAMHITDPFWCSYLELVRTKVIPYQWEALNDRIPGAEPSHCIHNFEVAAGRKEGSFKGMVFQDSDLYKWIEAAAYVLAWHPDDQLEATVDGVIDLICAAQQPDGYLNTYYILNGLDQRFTNLEDNHELYCLGHLTEAAVAYYTTTGKRPLLDAVIRYLDLIDATFGHEAGKVHGYPGHEVLELALIRLYEVQPEEKYLRLCAYLIDERGAEPLYFREEGRRYHHPFPWAGSAFGYQYYQAGKPVREQEKAEGHAVRAVYLYTGMAELARHSGDERLYQVCEKLWGNITTRQMYITGGIGAAEYGESFTYDYHLPNDTVYAETCASIGLVFFARSMLRYAPRGEYADVMEQALYNGVISGMALDGQSFFYVNPLEVVPEGCAKEKIKAHVKPVRQKWFGCACCPPNLARLLSSIAAYAYGSSEDTLYMHLYIGGQAQVCLNATPVSFQVDTRYPYEGRIALTFSPAAPVPFTLQARLPGWCRSYQVRVNGEQRNAPVQDGYLCLHRTWQQGDVVEIDLDMPVRIMHAHPLVREDAGKVAIMRGPLVYCAEQADNGANLHLLHLSDNPAFTLREEPDQLGGIVRILATGRRQALTGMDAPLYREEYAPVWQEQTISLVPYYAWANRGEGEMLVWLYR